MGGESDMTQRGITKELLGIDIAKRKSLPITIDDLVKSDLIIVAANDIPKMMFNYKSGILMKKVKIWKIKDEQFQRKGNIKRTILTIKRKVEKLNEQLEKRK